MQAIEYLAPRSVGEAVAVLASKETRARPFAGGTDILVQLRRGQSKNKLDPEVVGVLMLPIASLKDFSAQLASTLEKLNEAAKARSAEASTEAVQSALENL